MTYLIYCLWVFLLLQVCGEVDRLLRRRFTRWYESAFPTVSWYLPPVSSALIPGSGQFLNGQLLKGTLAILWPLFVGFSFFPRPWQMLQLRLGPLLLPWYTLVVLDALIFGLAFGWERNEKPAPADRPERDLSSFLERRRRQPRPPAQNE